jgi:hypothetical protein
MLLQFLLPVFRGKAIQKPEERGLLFRKPEAFHQAVKALRAVNESVEGSLCAIMHPCTSTGRF